MLTHEQCQSLLREDEMTDEVRAHLSGCDACRAYQQKLSGLDALLGLDADLEPSAALDHRVLARPRRRWIVWVPALAAACGLAVFALLPSGRGPTDDDLFVAENVEMLADLDLLRDFDAAEDFTVIAALGELQ